MRTEGDVGQCDLDLGSAHYIICRHRSASPQLERTPDQPDMLDAINTSTNNTVSFVLFKTPDTHKSMTVHTRVLQYTQEYDSTHKSITVHTRVSQYTQSITVHTRVSQYTQEYGSISKCSSQRIGLQRVVFLIVRKFLSFATS